MEVDALALSEGVGWWSIYSTKINGSSPLALLRD